MREDTELRQRDQVLRAEKVRWAMLALSAGFFADGGLSTRWCGAAEPHHRHRGCPRAA